ncbi:MAG: ABC transporter substrate-binding protein [Hyphomicrobiaceae bacterium]
MLSKLKTLVPALVCALASITMAQTQAQAQDKVTYQLGWIPTGEYAPYFSGVAKGFYKQEGIDLVMSRGFGSGDTVKKVAGGGAMLGEADISTVMLAAIREKAPVKCLMSEYTQSPHSIFVLESSGIKSLKDLVGKRIATSPGNSHQVYFPLLARLVGFDPSGVQWVNADPASWAGMLLAGTIDATPVFATHEYWQNKQAKKMGKLIKVFPFADSGFKIYTYCIMATDSFIASNGNLIRRFLRATKKSFLWARDNMEEAAQLHAKVNPEVDADDALGSMRIFLGKYVTPAESFGKFDPQKLKDTYAAVAMAQNLDPAFDPASLLDTRFLPE